MEVGREDTPLRLVDLLLECERRVICQLLHQLPLLRRRQWRRRDSVLEDGDRVAL